MLFVQARTVRAVASFSALGMAEAALAVAAVLNRESDSAAVKAWALQIIDAEDADFLVKNKVTGADLLSGLITEEKLLIWHMPGAPAARIMKAVELARDEGASREDSCCSIK